MRRFKIAHEGVKPSTDLVALWTANQPSSTATLADSSYSASFHLPVFPSGATLGLATTSFFAEEFTGSPNFGRLYRPSMIVASSAKFWQSSSAASAHNYFNNATAGFSLTGWFSESLGGVTVAFFEYASSSTVTVVGDLCQLHVNRGGGGTVRLAWDFSTASLFHTVSFPASASGAGGFFFGVCAEPSPYSAGLASYTVRVNNNEYPLGVLPMPEAGSGANGRFVIGGSRRLGTSSGTTAALTGHNTVTGFDDVCLFGRGSPEILRAAYRNGVRTWDERRLFESGQYKCVARVFVEDGDGNFVNLSDSYGTDFVRSVDLDWDVDRPTAQASISFMRLRGQTLNLSPLDESSVLNLNSALNFDAMLDLRRKVRIEVAVVPAEHTIVGWEFEPRFTGYIDNIKWNSESVDVDCLDEMAVLKDTFQVDPRQYDYYESEVLAETHMQTVIGNNAPRLLLGNATLTFNWLGGYTPVIYTPASSGWVLRWDTSPTGDLDGILQGLADQIGWDCRYRFYEPWQRDRLTFYEPPRDMALDIASISEDANGFTVVTTTVPHGLTAEQAITISGTTNYNGATTVAAVLSERSFRTFQTPAATPATETSGVVTYDAFITLNPDRVAEFDDLTKSTADIRNACVVRYNRDNATATLPLARAEIVQNEAWYFTVNTDDKYRHNLRYLEPGHEITIADTGDDALNGTFEILSFDANRVIRTSQVPSASTPDVAVTNTGNLSSEYLAFKSTFSCNTTSIARYGLRQAAVYEPSNSNIDTDEEAYRLATAIVSDLADPTADTGATLRPAAPWFELHDLLKLGPDTVRRRWSTTQTMAVTGVKHHFEGGDCYTRLTFRQAAPTLGTAWVKRIMVDVDAPGVVLDNKAEIDMSSLLPQIRSKAGNSISGTIRPMHKANSDTAAGRAGKRRLLHDITEIHISTSANFVPTQNTLAEAVRGSHWTITQDGLGNKISPGTTYYIRFRHRDIYGNLTKASTATSVVTRFNVDDPGALAYRIGTSANTFVFRGTNGFDPADAAYNAWFAYPFNDDSSSPAYDTYDRYRVGGLSSACGIYATFNYTTDGVTGAFQMPCNGVVRVVGQMAICNYAVGQNVELNPTAIRARVVRIGPTAGSGGLDERQPFDGWSVYLDNITPVSCNFDSAGPYLPLGSSATGTAGSVLFIRFDTQVTAWSGDYIAPVIKPRGFSGIGPIPTTGTTTSTTTSWVRYSLTQD